MTKSLNIFGKKNKILNIILEKLFLKQYLRIQRKLIFAKIEKNPLFSGNVGDKKNLFF